jgi:hypothetical protein
MLITIVLSIAMLLLPLLFFALKLSGVGIGITVLEGENIIIKLMITTSATAMMI